MDLINKEKFERIRAGSSVVELIQLLGEPDEAWGSLLDPAEMMLIYKGDPDRSIFLHSNMTIQGFEGCLGGPNATPFCEPINIVVTANGIELKRGDFR